MLRRHTAFTIQSSTVGSPIEITVTATDGIDSFVRMATAEFVQTQEIFNGEIGTTETLIRFAGLDIFGLISNYSVDLTVKAGLSSNNEVFVEIPRQSGNIGKVEIVNKNLKSEYDLFVLNAEVNGSGSGSRTMSHNLTDFQVAKFNFCVFPDILAATSNMRFLLRRSIFKKSINEIELPLSGKKLFARNSTSLSQGAITKIDVALSRGAMVNGHGVFLLDQSEMGDAHGRVYRGDETLYINSIVFNHNYDAWSFLVLAHEDHHVLQNNNCEYRAKISNPVSFSSDAQDIITESNADLAAFIKLRNLPAGSYTNLIGYSDFRGKSLNTDLNKLIELGFVTSGDNFEYMNDIYFDLIPFDEFNYVDLLSTNALQNNFPNDYLPKGVDFSLLAKNHLNFMIDKNNSKSYTRFGLTLPEAALDPTDRLVKPVGPYGFGYLDIQKSNYDLASKLMESSIDPITKIPKLDILRVKISHPDNISMPIITEANTDGAFDSITRIATQETDTNGDPFYFYDFVVKNKEATHGYFSVINNLSETSRFRVEATGPMCDNPAGEERLYSKVFDENGIFYSHCTDCDLNNLDNHYFPDTRVCITCDSKNPINIWNEKRRKCDECDRSNPDNNYFADTGECVQCSLSAGYQIYLYPSTGKRGCVYCPLDKGAVLRSDGTCDWPAPTMQFISNVEILDERWQCTGVATDLGYSYCEVKAKCIGGVFPENNLSEITKNYEGLRYRCESGSFEIHKYEEVLGTQNVTLTCRNPEGETVQSQPFNCPP
jgi:hypothetical protein